MTTEKIAYKSIHREDEDRLDLIDHQTKECEDGFEYWVETTETNIQKLRRKQLINKHDIKQVNKENIEVILFFT